MKCSGRTVLAKRRCGAITLVDALYARGTIDARHAHAFDQLSVVLHGDVLEVRGARASRQGTGCGSSQHAGTSHVLFFATETRVVSLTANHFSVPEFQSIADFWTKPELLPDDLPDLLFRARDARTPRVCEKPPLWLVDVLRTFPWLSDTALREASRRAGVHHAHFARTFQEHVGVSPRAFRRRMKVQAASERLLRGNESPAHVALECGFSDQSHLTAAFKAAYAIPPAKFRRIFTQTS